MKVLEVKKFGDPVLRNKSVEVAEVTPEIRELALDMIETMKDECGIGLAAPQVGHNIRMIAMDVNNVYSQEPIPMDATPGEHLLWNLQPLVMINPKIVGESEMLSVLDEGCLSIPNLTAEVVRPAEVEIEATIILERGTEFVNKNVRFNCGHLLATCFQHEIDHLDGILYVDRASKDERKALQKRLKKMEKQTLKGL